MKWKPAGLTRNELIAGLSFKIILGFIYGYLFLHFYGGDDTWKFHRISIEETQLLLRDPAAFFINEYTPAHALAEGTDLLHIFILYLNDLQYALFIKTFALLNVVTQGNYYINMCLFNVMVFFGHYWLFRALATRFPQKRTLFFLVCFFYVPAVFWLSGLRIDGLLFFFVGLFVRALVLSPGRQRILLLLVAFTGAFICRPQFAVLLVPAFIGFQLSANTRRPLKTYIIIYISSILLFLSSAWWLPGGGLTAMVAEKQHQFMALNGTRFELHKLSSHPSSYLAATPHAVANTFMRPLPLEAKGVLQWLASGEIMMFWLLVAAMLYFIEPDWKTRLSDPVILFILFAGVSVYLSIGYLVPFPGAIIRYKAIALLLFINVMATLTRNK